MNASNTWTMSWQELVYSIWNTFEKEWLHHLRLPKTISTDLLTSLAFEASDALRHVARYVWKLELENAELKWKMFWLELWMTKRMYLEHDLSALEIASYFTPEYLSTQWIDFSAPSTTGRAPEFSYQTWWEWATSSPTIDWDAWPHNGHQGQDDWTTAIEDPLLSPENQSTTLPEWTEVRYTYS